MMYEMVDKKYPNRLYIYDNYEVQFRNYRATVIPEVAYRISRTYPDSFVFTNGEDFVPYNPDSWRKDKMIIFDCNYASANGYGMVGENTAKFMKKLGYNVVNPGFISQRLENGGEFVDEITKSTLTSRIYPDKLEIQYCQPPSFRKVIVQRRWIYTMYESTHTPRKWIKIMNTADHVLVPSRWLVDSWQEQGLKVPISVYAHGVDTEYYHYVERPKREVFTFLHYCLLSNRKGSPLLAKAFQDEFGVNEPVRLIMKTTTPFFPFKFNIPNVEYIHATYSKDQMRQLMYDSDCFVFPTRGEGYGLPPIEAMSTGLPTIVTGWSGPMEYIDPSDTMILSYKMCHADEMDSIYEKEYEPGENSGEWADPDYEQLRHYMRWAFEHRDLASDMGKRCAERIARDFPWEKKVQNLIDIIGQYS